MKEKHPYLAMIFDFKRIPEYNFSEKTVTKKGITFTKTEKKFKYFSKSYDNKRWALYCSCGHMNEFPIHIIKRNVYEEIVSDCPLICNGCNKVYNSLSDVKMIYSRDPSANVTSKRFGIVEKDNFYALYSFATTVLVSATTKKLLFKDIPSKALYFSKKSDAIRIKNKEKIITVPFRFLVKHCSSVVNNMIENAQFENIISQGLFERQIISPLIKFCEIVESKCDQRDVEKIKCLLEKERNEAYYKTLFKDLEQNFNNYSAYVLHDCNYNIKAINECKSSVSVSRYIWIQYIKRRLCIMLSISVYPPIATLILSYGPDKFLDLLTHSSLMCSLTNLKKKKPTNPKDILEVMFKSKITSEVSKGKKILKYIRTEEKKRKRKLKAHPENASLNNKITTHPTEWVDSRVPVFKDVKKDLKKINFRKFYVDLFLEKDFDAVAKVFYAILNKNSVFDEIETIDKIILNNNIKDAESLITGFQSIYEQNRQRLGTFKLTYKHLCHIIKMVNVHKQNHTNWSYHLELYADTISMMQMMEIPTVEIFKAKNFKALSDMHNALSVSYQLTLDKNMSENLRAHIEKFRHTEGVFDNIKFSLLDTPERFYEESSTMNHCVKTYCSNVANGHYVIYSIEDITTGDRATLSININSNKAYKFNQLKAKNNGKSTEIIINCVKVFIKDFFNITDYNNSNDLSMKDYFSFKNMPPEEIVLQRNNLEPALGADFEEIFNGADMNIIIDDLPF